MPRLGGFSPENRKYRSTFSEQFPLILQRTAQQVFREKTVIGMKMMQTLLFATIFSIIYWRIFDRNQTLQTQDRRGMLFLVSSNLIMSNAMAILTIFFSERSTFERESRSGLYNLPAFFFSKMSIELPIYSITPVLLVSITYWAAGLNPDVDRFFTCCLISILLSVAGMATGLTTASFFRELSVALIVAPTAIMIMLVFCGMFVNLDGIPALISWIKWFSLMKYGFIALVKNEFENAEIGCGADVPAAHCAAISGNDIIKELGIEDQGSVWFNIGALAIWTFLLILLAYAGLWRMTCVSCRCAKIKRA
ncbi:ABC-2 type transporter-domain-containing protein [Thamnocephalis sphaerospora]|uniref:ABC-2 type transporter-domain-containing protein n=1 Tax=Thamnocephalis sphaerospora TaxID=78915 RepID=A0A4P9XHA1_9FUNG|nr:ABC-2 type transporter-domain-containing protein [Thamnocephalis sphaerospora]|eukprot:RKP05032.1 ABC-2 type transporter-domain-containing protein [Thamnocephalis sphaerospora]